MNSEDLVWNTFQELTQSLPNPLNFKEEGQKWIKAYSAPKRAYHNLDHIAALLKWIEKLPNLFPYPERAKWAAFYHDCIYVSTRKDNEARSAIAAQTYLIDTGMPLDDVKWIFEAIIRTAKHDGEGASPDMQAFLDCDLGILGSDWAIYSTFSKAIRKEYSRIPILHYRTGRKQVLTHFLEREYIYFSPYFREHFEAKARENLKREIESLR